MCGGSRPACRNYCIRAAFLIVFPHSPVLSPGEGGLQMKTLALCACAFALSVPAVLFGQAVYGSISGNVTDASGAAVPSAKVTITDTGKGVTYNTLTNESGNYTQGHLIVGIYDVRVEASGFSTYTQKNV